MSLYYVPDSAWYCPPFDCQCHSSTISFDLESIHGFGSYLTNYATAAPFQWAAIFHKEDINFVDGHRNLEWYDPTEKTNKHKLPCKVRCAYCHSPIMDEGRNTILLFPSLIHLRTDEEKAFFKPR